MTSGSINFSYTLRDTPASIKFSLEVWHLPAPPAAVVNSPSGPSEITIHLRQGHKVSRSQARGAGFAAVSNGTVTNLEG